mmetsp:Transcript_13108/g.40928  ORF Transcript_13108/g.40928 Transcript_13108/m.40928 type:complete len:218 (+) Transcript_13108:519-1172(+)
MPSAFLCSPRASKRAMPGVSIAVTTLALAFETSPEVAPRHPQSRASTSDARTASTLRARCTLVGAEGPASTSGGVSPGAIAKALADACGDGNVAAGAPGSVVDLPFESTAAASAASPLSSLSPSAAIRVESYRSISAKQRNMSPARAIKPCIAWDAHRCPQQRSAPSHGTGASPRRVQRTTSRTTPAALSLRNAGRAASSPASPASVRSTSAPMRHR